MPSDIHTTCSKHSACSRNHLCLIHSTVFPLKDSTMPGVIPMTCGKDHSPIGQQHHASARYLLLRNTPRPFIHVLTSYQQTCQWRSQDTLGACIKAHFPFGLALATKHCPHRIKRHNCTNMRIRRIRMSDSGSYTIH